MTTTQQAQMEEELRKRLEQQQREQMEAQRKLMEAQYWAQRSQAEMDNRPRVQYAAIVAVDLEGAFAKDGKIPWNYPEDFKWFQAKTKGHICVMGRTTYDDITNHLGDKANESVLPGRKCFVVTSRPLEKNNAIAIPNMREIEKHLTEDDIVNKKVWICGGERIYAEGIAMCDELYITVVDKIVDGDRHFPTDYTLKHFESHQVFKNDTAPDLRFTIWKRKNM